MIYLDNAATTAMFEEGADVYKKYACQSFYNPSASYAAALEISKDLDGVRNLILSRLNASKGSVIFTGGATESNNLAVLGSLRNGKQEYLFSMGEHPSVFQTAKYLESQGHTVHFVDLQPNGQVDYAKLESLLSERTRLISIMHVSNETGAINDLCRINDLRRKLAPRALFHVDGVQAFCKIDFSVDEAEIDLYTLSAHKFHGPKGVGALYVRNIQALKNIIYGGGQEGGYRSGTENVPGIMAMGFAIDKINVRQNFEKVQSLKKAFLNKLAAVEGADWIDSASPYIVSVGFKGVNGETLMRAVQDQGVIIGKGSACSTKKAGNRILESMGLDKEQVKSHVRISFSEMLTVEEVEKAAEILANKYQEILEKVR